MLQLYVDSSTAGDTWALEGELTIQVDTADTLESRAGGPGVVQVRDTHHSVPTYSVTLPRPTPRCWWSAS